MSLRVFAAIVVLALASACMGHSRIYSMPLTSAEGALVVPALVATAENMGLEARGDENSAMVTLEDGTRLRWFDRSGHFVLGINPAYEDDATLRDAKVRADQIWELAVQARQANNVGAVVVQPQRPPPAATGYAPPPPPGPTYAPPPSPAPAPARFPDGYACASADNCQSGTCVRGRCGNGGGSTFGGSTGSSGGSRAGGAACSFSSDCASGNCRGGVCQGGSPGAPCTFSSDCPGGNCRGGVCQGGAGGAPCTFSSDCPSGNCRFGKCE